MATLASNSTGNFTAAATWSLVDATSLSDSENTSSSATTTFQSSATFTPGAITIDGIGIKVLNRATAGTGTMSARLAIAGVPVAGTTVTIDVTDLPGSSAGSVSGWIFFKFAAPVLLVGATVYSVQISTSVNATVTVYRSATAADWSRFLRTTTTQAPAAADVLYVVGEYTAAATNASYTVTMDNTSSTVFGKMEVSGLGILSYGTAASTNYQLICNGNVLSNGAGSIRIGTSGSKIPATSTAVLQINQNAVNVTNAFSNRGTGDIQSWGNNKTWRTTLTADVSAGGTSLTSAVSTGWVTGEDILIASTTRTNSQTELKTLAVDSSGTTITVSALTNAHGGTSPTIAELVNITRNVKIRGESTTLQAYINSATDGTVNVNDTEFQYFGSGTANKRGWDFFNITTGAGSVAIHGCAFKNWEVASTLFLLNQATQDHITIDDCVSYRMSGAAITTGATTTTGVSITNYWAFNNIAAAQVHFNIAMQGGTFTDNRAIGASSNGFTFSGADNLGLTISNLISHSNGAAGFGLSATSTTNTPHTYTNLTSWRNTTRGIFISSSQRALVSTFSSYGNATSGVEITTSQSIDLVNGTIDGGSTLVQSTGISFTASTSKITIDSCTIGSSSAHSSSSLSISTARQWHDAVLRNCNISDTTEMLTQTNLESNAFVGSSKHDQTNGVHKTWRSRGTTSADSSIYQTSPLSSRATPSNATYKLASAARDFAIPSGKTAKISVFVRKSVVGDGTAYNGNFPRLILKENTAAGINSDTVLATATAASLGAFELISGTTVAVSDDTVLSCYVDCDGTTGWVNTDDWKIEIIDGSANGINIGTEQYWTDGYSVSGINTLLVSNSGSQTYWMNGKPATTLFPITTALTGKFFLEFD